MNYGTVTRYETKKAFREAVERRGAENVTVWTVAAFGQAPARTVAELAGTSAVIVGPDLERERKWYANIRIVKGEIRIV